MSFDEKDGAGSAPVLRDCEQNTSDPPRMCERLAKTHYENFTVGSRLLPRGLRRHVHNIYAYCRVCDDLADETNDPELSLRLLDWWREELHTCFEGRPRHSVFVALADTVREFDLPIEPFEDLISAFVQDQTAPRYATYDQLLDYCSRSANPVGRLFLCLLGYTDETRRALADCTCTALQLANFWQDIGADYERGRIYIPLEDMDRLGYSEAELRNHVVNAGFAALMRFEVARTRELFERGAALAGMIDGAAADVGLFTSGGMAVLKSIEQAGFRVFGRRITISKFRKLLMLMGWCARRLAVAARI
jgi:squalene synthase HpnC